MNLTTKTGKENSNMMFENQLLVLYYKNTYQSIINPSLTISKYIQNQPNIFLSKLYLNPNSH